MNIDEIKAGGLPEHVAVIMDGNGRWAKNRNLIRTYGHTEGLKRAKEIAKAVTKPEISKLEFTSTGDAATYLKENMKENDTVLVKASN